MDVEDLYVVETVPVADHRGSFMRCFSQADMADVLSDRKIVQINHSRTHAVGAVRGLHFQFPPHSEMKLVRCLKGRVLDVAVDLRRESPTFLKWHAEELSPENNRMMVIPEGMAHGFQVLEPDSELLYLHTAFYDATAEGGIRFDEPRVSVEWPLPVSDLSDRDRSHPLLTEEFTGIGL